MSAAESPDPQMFIEELGIGPGEAQMIADGMTPLQDFTGVGSALGKAMTGIDAPGPKFLGTVLEQMAINVNLLSTSLETFARGLELYVESQSAVFEEVFPPPDRIADQVGDDVMPLVEAIDRGFGQGL